MSANSAQNIFNLTIFSDEEYKKTKLKHCKELEAQEQKKNVERQEKKKVQEVEQRKKKEERRRKEKKSYGGRKGIEKTKTEG